MPADNRQTNFNKSSVYTDAVARVKNELSADQTRKSKHDKRFIFLLLFIMLLIVAQMIVLLAGNGLNKPPASVVEDNPVTLDDIKAVNDDFKEVMKSIDDIKAEPDIAVQNVTEQEEEVVELKIEPIPVITKQADSNIMPEKVTAEIVKPAPVKKSAALFPLASPSKKEIAINEKVSVAEIKLDYIKYDSNGTPLADNIEQWSCVHDTTTGLMWEVKSQGDAMRNSNNLYSWYDPDNKTLPGKSDGGRCEGDTDCDTDAYVQAMNERKFCGHNDWSLPTRNQMQTLINLKNGNDKVKINKQYFPQTVPSWYWTSSDEDNKADYAWYVLFRNGFALSDLKERPKHIRLVRKKSNDSTGGSNVY